MNNEDMILNPEPEVEILGVEAPEVQVEVLDEASDSDVQILSAEAGQPALIDTDGYVMVQVEDGDYEVIAMTDDILADDPDVEFLDLTADEMAIDAYIDDASDAPVPEIDDVFSDFLPDAGCDMPLDTDADIFA